MERWAGGVPVAYVPSFDTDADLDAQPQPPLTNRSGGSVVGLVEPMWTTEHVAGEEARTETLRLGGTGGTVCRITIAEADGNEVDGTWRLVWPRALRARCA